MYLSLIHISQLVAIVDPCGARTEYEYSLTGDLSRIVDATGVALSITHSRSHGEYSVRVEGAPGNYAVVTDALGRVVSASNSLMTMVPVSYTHLDVYKRQPLGRYFGTVPAGVSACPLMPG